MNIKDFGEYGYYISASYLIIQDYTKVDNLYKGVHIYIVFIHDSHTYMRHMYIQVNINKYNRVNTVHIMLEMVL